MSKDQWIADVERTEERFADDKLTADEFRAEMKSFGFNENEIADIVARIQLES